MADVKINGHPFTLHPKASAPGMYCKGYTLADVYDNWSNAKQNAYDYCMRLCNDLDGWNFRITGSNFMCFTVMFDFEHPETGELMRARITKDYNHLYYL